MKLFFVAFFLNTLLDSVKVIDSEPIMKQTPKTGQQLFEKNCVRCHGKDGGKKITGNTNLLLSTKTLNEAISVISYGKKRMPAWNKKFTESEIERVSQYVLELRK